MIIGLEILYNKNIKRTNLERMFWKCVDKNKRLEYYNFRK